MPPDGLNTKNCIWPYIAVQENSAKASLDPDKAEVRNLIQETSDGLYPEIISIGQNSPRNCMVREGNYGSCRGRAHMDVGMRSPYQ